MQTTLELTINIKIVNLHFQPEIGFGEKINLIQYVKNIYFAWQ